MYLTTSYQLNFLSKNQESVREDFLVMNRDLIKLYHNNACKFDNHKNYGYSFSLMFDQLADLPGFRNKMKNVDVCVLALLSLEFDPEFIHVGTYILDNYQFNCEIIELTEQAGLSLFQGIWLLKSFLSNADYKNGVIIFFEQDGCFSIIEGALSNSVGALFYDR